MKKGGVRGWEQDIVKARPVAIHVDGNSKRKDGNGLVTLRVWPHGSGESRRLLLAGHLPHCPQPVFLQVYLSLSLASPSMSGSAVSSPASYLSSAFIHV